MAQAKGLCAALLSKDAAQRMNAEEAMAHPWLASVASGAEVALSHDGRPGYAYATPLASPDDMVARPNARFRLRKRRCGIAH